MISADLVISAGLRGALCAVFAAHGFIYASFAVRIPAVKEQVSASSAALGLALLGLSAGAVATMLLAGALCRRFGSPRMTVISCALLSATLVLPALARSAITLGLLLAVFGAAYGCLNVAMNSVAVDIVAALRRRGPRQSGQPQPIAHLRTESASRLGPGRRRDRLPIAGRRRPLTTRNP